MTDCSATQKRLMIIAGEVSGDHHGAHLVRQLKELDRWVRFVGIGGNGMREQGVELLHTIDELAVLGLVEVIRHYPAIRRIFFDCVRYARDHRPDAVILIDYPGFNIRFAKRMKKLGIPVIYYISPQIWAWGQHRKKVIANCVNKMLVFFDFEKDFYTDTGLDVTFVGHPLVESVEPALSRTSFYTRNNIDMHKPLVGLLPGSRKNEIRSILPIMIESAYQISLRNPQIQFVLPIGPAIPRERIDDILENTHREKIRNLHIAEHQVHETMAYSDIVMVASGTATLETACFATPMVIIYKVNYITSILARLLIRIPYIGLVNVVAGEKIIPEFLQHEARPKLISACVESFINNPKKLDEKRSQLKQIKQKLGEPGAVRRAAQSIIDFLSDTRTTRSTVQPEKV